MPKKRRKEASTIETDISSDEEEEKDKYKMYRDCNYKRLYSESSSIIDYIVYVESSDETKYIGDKDIMYISNIFNKSNKGIKRFHRINKNKISVLFDSASNANKLIQNDTFLREFKLSATIPAKLTECTGVIKNVPLNLSNKQIFTLSNSEYKIISVRRIMRRQREENNTTTFVPTKSVSITFSSINLPKDIDLNFWKFSISTYIPPVKQCYNCLRYGHLSKYCKNKICCSICTEQHSFKDCTKDTKNAICFNCKGNHIAISGLCPIKRQKIEENKRKLSTPFFSNLFDTKSFPALPTKNKIYNTNKILQSEEIINFLIKTIVKFTTDKTTPVNNENIKTFLQQCLDNGTLAAK